jgi:dTDP-4-dehydrorhamnose reductase
LFLALAQRRIHTVFFSSDMVFAGDAGGYAEDNACHPTTEYGRQKLDAERALRECGGSSLIVRLGKLYARDARDTSPLSAWYRAWAAGQKVRCAHDQWLMPTWAGDVAALSLVLAEQRRSGIVHMVAPQAYTRLELARLLARQWGVDDGLIEPCSIREFDFAEPRPLNNCLRGERLREWLDWQYFAVEKLRYGQKTSEQGVF